MNKEFSLIIDIGNSQISAGLFEGLEIKYRLDVESEESISSTFGVKLVEFLNKNKIKKESIKSGFICSVVPNLTRWIQIVVNQTINVNCVLMDKKAQKLIKKDSEITEDLGGDLIADIIAAIEYYGTPCIVTDLGTVTKTLIIDKDGVFLGAKFYPGLRSSFQSLGEKTALLPSFKEMNIDREKAPDFKFGKNTIDCMRAGIYWGTVSAITYSNRILCHELGANTKHIITGGYSNFMKEGLSKEGMIGDCDLVLKGIALIANKMKV